MGDKPRPCPGPAWAQPEAMGQPKAAFDFNISLIYFWK